MSESRHGEIDVDDVLGTAVVRFTRTMPYRPQRVWDHLVDRDHLHEWLTSKQGGHIRHRVGGEVTLPTIGGAVIDSFVDTWEPAEALGFGWETRDWSGGEVLWLLDPHDDGTAVTFEHADLADGQEWDQFARTMATWHLVLDLFEQSLAGSPGTWDFTAWERLYRHYGRWIVQDMHLQE
jgi:uncharacterized protein YndB with AHSA1/START domain